jgi:Cu(I)/Ag(I) efflux system membrane protein CusA/SilA
MAREYVSENVTLPSGYTLIWSGQYENMQAVASKLTVIIPATLFIILILLYIHFRSISNTLIVLLSLPFSLIGGIWLIYMFGFNTSVAIYIGFIALAGLAAETGVVMLVYLNETLNRYRAENRLNSISDLKDAIIEGAVERVRPKIMTVATTILALLPAMLGSGTGAEVIQRIAAPMVGGMISSMSLTLIVVPSLYYIVNLRKINKET